MKKSKVKDINNTKKVEKALSKLNKKIDIGFFREDGAYSSDTYLNVVDLARVHEFGIEIKVTKYMKRWFVANGYPLKSSTKTIILPERAFLRNAFDHNVAKINNLVDKAIDEIKNLQGNPDSIIDKLAKDITEILKDSIDLGNLSSKMRYEVRDV